jgi:iron complex outermembrane receptor protein
MRLARRFHQTVLAAVVGSLPLAAIFGQTPPRRDSVAALPAITVTANRADAEILNTPLAVSKVTAPSLRGVSGFGVDEALSLVPGVLAQSRYGTSDVRILIRGFGARGAGDRSNAGTSRGIRVLTDGIPETEPDGRTSFDFLDLGTAEAVEVIRSNASSVWGNAAGGVINILTVPYAASARLELQPVLGAFGLNRHVFRASAPVGTGTAFGSYTNTTFEGWRAHSDARRVVANAGLSGHIGDGTRVALFASGVNNLSHLPGPLTQAQVDADPRQANATYATRDERRYNRIARVAATVDHEIDDRTSFSSMFFASPKYLQRSERNSFRDFTRYHVGGNFIGRSTVTVSPTFVTNLTAGVDEAYQDGAILFYRLTAQGTRDSVMTDNKGEGANNLGVFAQSELVFNDKLRVLLGARYDNVSYHYKSFLQVTPVRADSRRFERITPKLGVSYSLDDHKSVYANVGGGIEVPAGNETDPTPGAPPSLLNPLLDPIRSTTYEVGFKSIASRLGTTPFTLSYDLAGYNTEVTNEIVPYNGGRYYLTAAKARRTGVEVGVAAAATSGIFANVAFTWSRNRYQNYVVDSALLGRAGARADYSGNEIVGIPPVIAHVELGTEVPGLRSVRVKGGIEHLGAYFADDANKVSVPSYSIFDLTAELRNPILAASGWGIRGFVTVRNVTDRKYIGSAFLNPDIVNGAPAAFEPGTPRAVIFSLTAGRLR